MLRLAGPPEFTTTCVLPALAELVRSGLRLQLTLGRPAEKLLAGLDEGEYDLVVSTTPPDPALFTVTELYREEFVLVASPDLVREIGSEGPQALAGLPMVAYSEDRPLIRRYWREVFGEEPGTVPAAVVPDLRGVLSLAVAGAGFTVLPYYLCRDELASGALVPVMDPPKAPANTIFLATQGSGNRMIADACRALIQSSTAW